MHIAHSQQSPGQNKAQCICMKSEYVGPIHSYYALMYDSVLVVLVKYVLINEDVKRCRAQKQ